MNSDDIGTMSEAQLAEHFHRHRGELAGEEIDSRAPTRLDVMVSARLSRDEASALRAAAERASMSLSAFLRQSALTASTTNVVDLDRVRQDVARVHELASDAIRALA
jgi:uncharacterized protein (DUF1778 family)